MNELIHEVENQMREWVFQPWRVSGIFMFSNPLKSVQYYTCLSFIHFCSHFTGLSDPQRLECNVQYPGHPWDCSGIPEPGAVWPRPVRARPRGESVSTVQLRPIRRWRAELRRERTGTDHPKNSGCGADRDLQMDFGHGELSQDADSANSAPGKWAACAFHLQLSAVDTHTDWQTFQKAHPRGNLTFSLLLEKLSKPR